MFHMEIMEFMVSDCKLRLRMLNYIISHFLGQICNFLQATCRRYSNTLVSKNFCLRRGKYLKSNLHLLFQDFSSPYFYQTRSSATLIPTHLVPAYNNHLACSHSFKKTQRLFLYQTKSLLFFDQSSLFFSQRPSISIFATQY